MPADLPFDDLMTRLRQGDEEAAATVFRRFARRLIGLARQRLDGLVRPKVDPEEIVQSVFRSFFRRHGDGRFDLDDWGSLWGLLARITVRKCAKKNARYRAPCRDVRKEVSSPSEDGDQAAVWLAVAREPTPEDAAVLLETVEQVMRGLAAHEREIVVLRLQGHSTAEVSAALDCTERKVQRVIGRVRQRLERLRVCVAEAP
jgi:RNA polymerase sigma-70 factor (ECF subfamily)